jgi:hypothetical protein
MCLTSKGNWQVQHFNSLGRTIGVSSLLVHFHSKHPHTNSPVSYISYQNETVFIFVFSIQDINI